MLRLGFAWHFDASSTHTKGHSAPLTSSHYTHAWLPSLANPLHLLNKPLTRNLTPLHPPTSNGHRRMFIRHIEGVLQQSYIRCLQRLECLGYPTYQQSSLSTPSASHALNQVQRVATHAPQIPIHQPSRPSIPTFPPRINHDRESRPRPRFPAPDTQALINGLQHAQVLVDAVPVPSTGVEDVEGGVEEEGEFEVRGRRAGVRGEEGDVERVVLRLVSVGY